MLEEVEARVQVAAEVVVRLESAREYQSSEQVAEVVVERQGRQLWVFSMLVGVLVVSFQPAAEA